MRVCVSLNARHIRSIVEKKKRGKRNGLKSKEERLFAGNWPRRRNAQTINRANWHCQREKSFAFEATFLLKLSQDVRFAERYKDLWPIEKKLTRVISMLCLFCFKNVSSLRKFRVHSKNKETDPAKCFQTKKELRKNIVSARAKLHRSNRKL